MLRSVQHDKSEDVIPNASEESGAMWMLHFAALRSAGQIGDGKPHPVVPRLAKGAGRLRQQTG